MQSEQKRWRHSLVVMVCFSMSRQMGHISSLCRLRGETAISVPSRMASWGGNQGRGRSENETQGPRAISFQGPSPGRNPLGRVLPGPQFILAPFQAALPDIFYGEKSSAGPGRRSWAGLFRTTWAGHPVLALCYHPPPLHPTSLTWGMR